MYIHADQNGWDGVFSKEKRGIKRVYLPSPHDVQFIKDTTYEHVLAYGRETFFSDLPEEEAAYYLAHSSGVNLPSFNPRMSLCLGIKYYTPSKTSLDPPMLRRSGEFPEDTIF